MEVEALGLAGRVEELGAVGVGPRVGHCQLVRAGKRELRVELVDERGGRQAK
jgi:hypothetical protein